MLFARHVSDLIPSRVNNHVKNGISKMFSRRPYLWNADRAYISFTFDDFPRSALITGGHILQRYSIRGSYYVSLGRIDCESPVGSLFGIEHLMTLLEEGHELGCHTYDHIDAWNGEAELFEQSIVNNRNALRRLLGAANFATMSYPKAQPHPRNKLIAEKHFTCCRGGGQTFNHGTIDLNLLSSCFIDNINMESEHSLKQMIDQNVACKGWLIFSTHDISENPSRFGCTPEFFDNIARHAVISGSSILPVCEVYKASINFPHS